MAEWWREELSWWHPLEISSRDTVTVSRRGLRWLAVARPCAMSCSVESRSDGPELCDFDGMAIEKTRTAETNRFRWLHVDVRRRWELPALSLVMPARCWRGMDESVVVVRGRREKLAAPWPPATAHTTTVITGHRRATGEPQG